MTYEKFETILNMNKGLSESLMSNIEEFKGQYGVVAEDIISVLFDIIQSKSMMVLLPLKDNGVGAIHFAIGDDDIVIINTNQPRNKMYFSSLHDLYHILYQNHKDEDYLIHLNAEEYNSSDMERAASFFAANVLMPEDSLRKAFGTFSRYTQNHEELLVRLMIKFNAPLEAVVIRLYELNLFNQRLEAKQYLGWDSNQVKALMIKYHQSTHILEPVMTKDLSILDKHFKRIRENDIISTYDIHLLHNEIYGFIEAITVKEEE